MFNEGGFAKLQNIKSCMPLEKSNPVQPHAKFLGKTHNTLTALNQHNAQYLFLDIIYIGRIITQRIRHGSIHVESSLGRRDQSVLHKT